MPIASYEVEAVKRQVEDELDRLLDAKSAETVAGINAARCQTRWDWTKASEAEDAFLNTREDVIKKLVGLVLERMK